MVVRGARAAELSNRTNPGHACSTKIICSTEQDGGRGSDSPPYQVGADWNAGPRVPREQCVKGYGIREKNVGEQRCFQGRVLPWPQVLPMNTGVEGGETAVKLARCAVWVPPPPGGAQGTGVRGC